MLTSAEILTKVRNLADAHNLWAEIERLSTFTRRWVVEQLRPPVTSLTTTQLHALCFGAAINEYALVQDEPIVLAPTEWQRNFERHGIAYKLITSLDPPLLSHIRLDLTPEEWCETGMNTGRFYLGDRVPTLQDIMNTAFRLGGWISAEELLHSATLSLEWYGIKSPHVNGFLVDRWFDRVEVLTPWERLGCLYQMARGHLKGES